MASCVTITASAPGFGYLATGLHSGNTYETAKKRIYDMMSYAPLQNAMGMPGMSVPLHMSKGGLPIGSHFVAPRGRDALLFELA